MKSSSSAELKHSIIGIVSFCFACAGIVSFLLAIFLAMKMAFSPGVISAGGTTSPEAIKTFMSEHMGLIFSIGALYFLFFVSFLVSFVCGIISVFQKNVKKIFGIIGLVVSSIVVAFLVMTIIIGLTSGGYQRRLDLNLTSQQSQSVESSK